MFLFCFFVNKQTGTEKRKQLGAHFNRSGVDSIRSSFTLPKKEKHHLPSPDTISLIDTTGSVDSLDTTTGLMGSKHLSNSLLDISEAGEYNIGPINVIACLLQ